MAICEDLVIDIAATPMGFIGDKIKPPQARSELDVGAGEAPLLRQIVCCISEETQ